MVSEYQEELKEIKKAGFRVSVKNEGQHWVAVQGDTRIDYWPSTERYQVTRKSKIQRGFTKLIEEISLASQTSQTSQSKESASPADPLFERLVSDLEGAIWNWRKEVNQLRSKTQ